MCNSHYCHHHYHKASEVDIQACVISKLLPILEVSLLIISFSPIKYTPRSLIGIAKAPDAK